MAKDCAVARRWLLCLRVQNFSTSVLIVYIKKKKAPSKIDNYLSHGFVFVFNELIHLVLCSGSLSDFPEVFLSYPQDSFF